jgi:hypothetical protein
MLFRNIPAIPEKNPVPECLYDLQTGLKVLIIKLGHMTHINNSNIARVSIDGRIDRFIRRGIVHGSIPHYFFG